MGWGRGTVGEGPRRGRGTEGEGEELKLHVILYYTILYYGRIRSCAGSWTTTLLNCHTTFRHYTRPLVSAVSASS